MKVLKRSSWWRRVARRLGRELFKHAENNEDPRVGHNGERWFLEQLLRAHVRAGEARRFEAIDAGANVGDYSRLILQTAQATGCPVEVHAFEPSPLCAAALRAEFANANNIKIVAAALGDRAGEALLHAGTAGSSQSSLFMRPGVTEAASSALAGAVPLMRLWDYMEARQLRRIDLLKLDVEGSELAALRGAGARLRPEIVDAIQFEYGGATMDAGVTLRDLFRLLEASGYVLMKVFPSALEVRTYWPWMEHYAYANYAAISPRWLKSRVASE